MLDYFKYQGLTSRNLIIYENFMDENGYKLYPDMLLKRIELNEEKAAIAKIYSESFIEFDDLMGKTPYMYSNIGLFYWGELVASVTYNNFIKKKTNYCNIILLAVSSNMRGKGYGKSLIDEMKSRNEYIVLFASRDTIEFYSKLDFYKSEEAFDILKDLVKHQTNSVFMCWKRGCMIKS
jgi:ribosomal protein S18 acetylase RimI-like enzyme